MRRAAALVVLLLSAASAPPAGAALHVERDPRGAGRIVDDRGREVLLRGVNVNALVDYWRSPFSAFPTTFPVGRADAVRMARMGLNAVRLAISWSRVEPSPGRYDAAYLRRVAALARTFEREGLHTIVDLHQDAWGPTLAAAPGTVCPAGSNPALGWDGAPGWATLVGDGTSRCTAGETRETSPAVLAAWASFWADRRGPGGVGIQSRYVAMLRRLAGTLARTPGVVGYDVMNEPGAVGEAQNAALAAFYGRAVRALRAAPGPRRLALLEPSVLWSATGSGPPPRLPPGRDVVYAPHLYTGGFSGGPITRDAFATARAEARALGGVPVLTGEWGADPDRASEPRRSYFTRHQDLQDEFRFGATLWTWSESCGDPHKAADLRAGRVPEVWGVFDVRCTDNRRRGLRRALVADLTRGRVRAAPGRLRTTSWSPRRVLRAAGRRARAGRGPLVAWHPARHVRVASNGLAPARVTPWRGGSLVVTAPRAGAGGRWSLVVRPR
jgi:endoglycosylceramidase